MSEPDLQSLAPEVERDIKAYNEAFVQANHTGDPTLMREWMRLPVTVFGNASIRTLETPEDVDTQYRRGIESLAGTGYKRSILSDFAIRVLNPTTALVECRAVREREDGSIIADFNACYLMAKTSDRWQIANLISKR